jgi:hypothetical protein
VFDEITTKNGVKLLSAELWRFGGPPADLAAGMVRKSWAAVARPGKHLNIRSARLGPIAQCHCTSVASSRVEHAGAEGERFYEADAWA